MAGREPGAAATPCGSEQGAVNAPDRQSPTRRDSGDMVVVSVDITCDLMDEDETGLVWTFLSDARDPSLIEPGAIVVAGDPDAPAIAEVIDIVEKPTGHVVHLRLLPGTIDDYESLVRRAITPAT